MNTKIRIMPNLIFQLIINNIVKSIMIVTALISFNYAGTFPDKIDEISVISDSVLLAISIFTIVISLLIGISDDDYSWEFRYCFRKAISGLIECEIEEGRYYYICLGRLLYIEDEIENNAESISRKCCLNNFNSLDIFPKFKTKVERRNNILSNIGI